MHKLFTLKVLILLLIAGPVGQFLLFKFTPLYDLNLLSKLYDEADWVKSPPKILIMGSSHAKYQIIPADIAKLNQGYIKSDIVNIAENAASPFHMYHAYMKGKEKFTQLEKVYYTLEPHILGEKYRLYLQYEKNHINYQQWQYFEARKTSNGYFYPFQQFIDTLKFSIPDRSLSNGYIAKGHKDFIPFSKGKVAVQVFDNIELFPVSDFQMLYLSKLSRELRRNQVELYFVLTPTYSWHKYYQHEAVAFDQQLIEKLNQSLGKSVVIGSMWSEDYGLGYVDFYDDTHLTHSGAQKFTRKVFKDISAHSQLVAKDFKPTFQYRESDDTYTSLGSSSFLAASMPWSYDASVAMKKSADQACFDSSNIQKSMVVTSNFPLISGVSSIELNFSNSGPLPTKLAVTLRNGDHYGHFFLEPAEYEKGEFLLTPIMVDKFAESFNFNEIDSLSVRLYPQNREVQGFCLSEIIFNK